MTTDAEEAEIDLFMESEEPSEDLDADEGQDVDETSLADADDDDDEDFEAEDEDEGDDDDEDAEAPKDLSNIPDDALVQVKVNGELVTKTVGEVKQSFASQAHNQQRHESLKAQEQAIAQAAQQMQQAQQAVMQLYQQAEQVGFQGPPVPPDRSMMQHDPIGYMEAKANFDYAQEQWSNQQRQVQSVREAQQYQEQLVRQQHIAAQQEILAEKFPDFKENREAFQTRLVKGAQEHYGLQPAMFNNIADAYAIEILNDALAYRDLKAGKKAARKQPQDVRGVTRPTAKPAAKQGQRRAQTVLERAKKTQSDDAWADVFLT